MPAAFWRALSEVQQRFDRVGNTHQERINNLIASMRNQQPPEQRTNLHTLSDVADNTDHLRNILLAILPPEVTDPRSP